MAGSRVSVDEASGRHYFENCDGAKLHFTEYKPAGKPKAIIMAVHGYAHHHGKYIENLKAKELWQKDGYHIAGLTHYGHGHSDGLRVLVKDYTHLVRDVGDFVKSHLLAQYGDSAPPVFLIGQSMGGAISIKSTLPGEPLHGIVRGTVLLAPMCKIADEMMMPEWQISMFRFLGYLLPTVPLTPVPPTIDWCFKDPVKLAEAKNDPLGWPGRPRFGTALQMLDFTLEVNRRLTEYDTPFIVCHGTADRVTSPGASEELVKQSPSLDKQLKLYEDMWHGLLSEPDGGNITVLNDCKAWVEARL